MAATHTHSHSQAKAATTSAQASQATPPPSCCARGAGRLAAIGAHALVAAAARPREAVLTRASCLATQEPQSYVNKDSQLGGAAPLSQPRVEVAGRLWSVFTT
jgi:hypothetical protein